MKRLVLYAAAIYAVVIGMVIAWRLADIVFVFLASLAVAATARAPIRWLSARRVPGGLATAIVYGLTGLTVVALLILLYDRLGTELASFSEDIGYVYARLVAEFRFLGQLVPSESARLPTPDELTQWLTDQEFGAFRVSFVAFGENVARVLADAALVVILSIYWTVDHLRFERFVLSLLTAERRAVTRRVWRVIEARVGHYLRGEIAQSLLAGVLLAPIFTVLGVRWAITWALAIAVTWLVPFIGTLLAIGPMAVVIYVQSGPLRALAAVLSVLGVFLLLQFTLSRVMYRRQRGTSAITILIALVMVDAFGLVGLVLAPPLAEALNVLYEELTNSTAAREGVPETTADLARLDSRLTSTRALVPTDDSPASLRLANLADRLQELLSEARTVAK